jgi:hypothetical protein
LNDPIYIAATTALALAAGGGLGFWFGRRNADDLTQRLQRAEKDAQAQQARAAEAARALQNRAALELQEARASWQAAQVQASAAQRAELEKLTRHLADAYDELDRLRVIAARAPGPPDTGQGFAATMPLGDL